jgi:hypothetical protein
MMILAEGLDGSKEEEVQLTQVPSTPSEASALTAMISKSTTD